MKIQIFNGGLNTRLAPQMLKQNQGVVYTNIDPTKGTLLPEKDKLAAGITSNQYVKYFEADDEWVSSTTETEYLEFQGKLYSTDGVQPKKRSGGVTQNLGITLPSGKPSPTVIDSAVPLEELTAINYPSGGDLPVSDLEYLLVNIKNGQYSAPYRFTVYASASDRVRADGGIQQLGSDGTYTVTLASPLSGTNTITTVAGNTRKIGFMNLKGDFADEAKLFRRYQGEWRLVYTFATIGDSVEDTTEDISANDLLDESLFSAFNGTYQYVYTYYNANDGTESAPSPLSDEVSAESGFMRISGITASSDPQVTNIRLYRVGGNLTQFSLVTTLSNTTQTYDDNSKDTEIDGRLLESENFYAAPSNLRFISESYAMLFGAVGSQLRFTPIGKPNAWPPEYFIEFDSPITGLGPVANGLLVMTKFKTYIVTGSGPLTLAQQSLRGDQGCISHSSVQEAVEGTLLWASADGLCMSSGNNVKVITKNALGKYTLSPVSSAVVDEVYYCLNSDDTVLVWDYRFEQIPRLLALGVQYLTAAKSELYGWSAGSLYKLFQGTSNLSLTYKSPRYIEGSMTKPKVYKRFYFRHNGDILIKIIIDDKVVISKNLTGNNTSTVQVPQAEQRGYYVQFEVTGTGELEELEYVAESTRNG